MTTPFTYLIGWTKHDIWYYGAKYARGCNPSDLWTTYFTSSKHVVKFIEDHGQPDVIEIRHTFKTEKAARAWEERVLRKIDAVNDERWLNKCVGNGGFYSAYKVPKTESARKNIAEANRRKAKDPEFIEKLKQGMRSQKSILAKQAPRSAESNEKRSATMKLKPKIVCEFCGKQSDPGNHKKNHGSNCKSATID